MSRVVIGRATGPACPVEIGRHGTVRLADIFGTILAGYLDEPSFLLQLLTTLKGSCHRSCYQSVKCLWYVHWSGMLRRLPQPFLRPAQAVSPPGARRSGVTAAVSTPVRVGLEEARAVSVV